GVDAFRTECHGATIHPLKGNSVFSEREALLKCTERFGPNLVAATRIDAKDLLKCCNARAARIFFTISKRRGDRARSDAAGTGRHCGRARMRAIKKYAPRVYLPAIA